jgi:hypothetical protein
MEIFNGWKDFLEKDAEEKKKFFNAEVKRIMVEAVNAEKAGQAKAPVIVKGENFSLSFTFKHSGDFSHINVILFSIGGKLLYSGNYDYINGTYKPEQDILYIDFVLENMEEIIPIFNEALGKLG